MAEDLLGGKYMGLSEADCEEFVLGDEDGDVSRETPAANLLDLWLLPWRLSARMFEDMISR